MDAVTRAHIFEPFFTTKALGKGTGLGLATVHGIIAQSGGHIEVASEPDQGTIFRMYLPLVNTTEQSVEVESPPDVILRGCNDLLVEDELLLRNLTTRALREYGYQVLEAENGAAALELIRSHTGPIDLLLTDVIMPNDLNGHQLAEQVLTLFPTIKVLYMSATANR